jgi:hypothetical protein
MARLGFALFLLLRVSSSLFAQNPPNILTVSPTTGAAGTQVTITGSGFGSVQGSGSVWLGSTYATVVSWSDTSVVASIASNSTSGTAQVQQGGVWSNAVAFNVNTATISSVSPTSGVPGTQVTITGSGFGVTQGSGQVWLGTASGAVQIWSDTQVVAVVASGSTTGNAQILQGGVWSNPIPFSVNSLNIASVTPNSGGPGTSVTITGTGFGSSQGNGTVWLGSINGQVINWNDTEVDAVVAPDALTGIARIEQNGVWSNALSFTVPSSGGSALTIVPNMLNLVVGEMHTIQALNSSGQPITGLTWTSSDTNVVSLSIDDPPILTVVAAGHVTITAGTASADIAASFSAPPTGTVIWSNPGDGSGVDWVVPAVPSPSGVADIFAFQADGAVQAVKSDGTTAWTATASQIGPYPWYPYVVPDFQGGLVVANVTAYPPSITKLDGITGQPYPAYTPANQSDVLSLLAVHTDGTIFALDTNNPLNNLLPGTTSVIGIDPKTGTQKFSVPLDQSTSSSTYNWAVTVTGSACGGSSSSYEVWNAPMFLSATIAGDGYAYVAYEYQNETSVGNTTGFCLNSEDFSYNTVTTTDTVVHLMLLRVGTDGSSSKIDVKDWEPTSLDQSMQQYDYNGGCGNCTSETTVKTGAVPSLQQVSIITNADQGTVLSWEADSPEYCASASGTNSAPVCNTQVSAVSTFGLARTLGSSLVSSPTVNVPSQATPIYPVLQAQDGSFIGAVGVGPTPGASTQYDMIAFDQSGSVKWNMPNDWPYIATADGGVIGYSGTTYDQHGNATGQNAGLVTETPGWMANALGRFYSFVSGAATSVASSAIPYATTYAAISGGNNSGSGTAVQQEWFPDLPSCPLAPPDQGPCAKEAIRDALGKLRMKMLSSCPACSTYVFNILGSNQQQFYKYLTRAPRLFDGTRSNAPTSVFCPSGFWSQTFCTYNGEETVSAFMADKENMASAASQTPSDSGEGPMIFFDPQVICKSLAGDSKELLNEAMLFHESLHGYYGIIDPILQDKFDQSESMPNVNITYYLDENVLGGMLVYLHDLPTDPAPLQCPN